MLLLIIKISFNLLSTVCRSPSIIVMDDIDSLFVKRDSTQNETQQRLVASLLTLMDGMASVSSFQIESVTTEKTCWAKTINFCV